MASQNPPHKPFPPYLLRPHRLNHNRRLPHRGTPSSPSICRHKFAGVDMRIRVKGGGHTSQIYTIRQSISKALVAYYQKFVDEEQKKEIKDILVRYDRTLLVADPRRSESKKFGGRGARARFQKLYR